MSALRSTCCIAAVVWAAAVMAAPGELYRSVVDLPGGGDARLIRTLNLAPDGNAELVTEYSGGKPSTAPNALQQQGTLLQRFGQTGRLLHKGSWKEINGRITVYLTTLYTPAAQRIADTLVLQRRGDRLDAVRYDRELYGRAGLHFARANEPIVTTVAYPGHYARSFTGAGGQVEDNLLVGDNHVVQLVSRYPQGPVTQTGTWITDGHHLIVSLMLKNGQLIKPDKIVFELRGDALAAVDYDKNAYGPDYVFKRLETAAPLRAAAVKVERGAAPFGTLVVTVAGQERRLADNAASGAWMIEGGKTVVYAIKGGAGGYENEGQALYRYDITTQSSARLAALQHPIKAVAEVQSKSGRSALLVEMSDTAIGAPHAAIVDPTRGLVWRSDYARFGRAGAGQVAVERLPRGELADGDWSKVAPFKIESLDLDRVLRGQVVKP